MAKSSRGGKAKQSVQRLQAPKAAPVKNASTGWDDFQKMTDDQKAAEIVKLSQTQVPVFLAQNDLQKVLYGMQIDDKPELVDDAVLDKMPGKMLYRTVNDATDTVNRLRYSAKDVANQNMKGSVTRVSDTGGSVHGRGIYFAERYGSSTSYGRTSNDINKTAVFRAKLNKNARVISESNVRSGLDREIRSGSKLGKALQSMNTYDGMALYAISRGYNVIQAAGVGYDIVLNRKALTIGKSVKPKQSSW